MATYKQLVVEDGQDLFLIKSYNNLIRIWDYAGRVQNTLLVGISADNWPAIRDFIDAEIEAHNRQKKGGENGQTY